MKKQLILNAFETNAPGFAPPGQWCRPGDGAVNYTSLRHWTELAQILEKGKFDGIFFQDLAGVLDVYGGNGDAAIRAGSFFPQNDPMLLLPAMAQVTQNLGFAVTGNLSYEPPYAFARRMSTLDHLTEGRIGWNIVTGYIDSAARAMGLPKQLPHDERYEAAEEFVEIMYKLWEGSWEDDAVVCDRERRIYALPEKVHTVRHAGKYFNLEGIHRSEPSPQRTPLLFQAGSSAAGRGFAARHCECVFVSGQTRSGARDIANDLRRQVAANGRDPADLKVLVDAIVILGPTEAAALARLEEHRACLIPEGAWTMISAALGLDLAKLGLDEPIRFAHSEANKSAVEGLTKKSEGVVWTPRKIAADLHMGRGATIVGTPEQVADEMALWIEETGIDGFNLSRGFSPGTFVDIVEMLVPELQRRGLFKREYRDGTFRQKIQGHGNGRLPESHPAARQRRHATPVAAAGSRA